MKKVIITSLICFAALSALILVLNINVSIQQGINYRVHSIRMPLYIKILDFMDRHYNYQLLIQNIISKNDTQCERVIKVFNWTHENIRPQPSALPVVDDHVWHIIIRGYGATDQMSDVFTTLCNYAGIDAFFDFIYSKDGAGVLPLSFVRLDNEWRIFYPAGGVYFINKKREFASLKDIKAGDWQAFDPFLGKEVSGEEYKKFLDNLIDIKVSGLKRANIQSPFRRLLFQIKRKVLKI